MQIVTRAMLRVWSLFDAPVKFWVLPADLYRTYCEKTSFRSCLQTDYAGARFLAWEWTVSVLVYVYLSYKCNRAYNSRITAVIIFLYIYVCYHLSILWLIFVNVFVGSLPQFFNAWVDYLLYSYDLSLKAFSVSLLNLFRLKSWRNKRSEPYYYPLLWRALRNTARYIY